MHFSKDLMKSSNSLAPLMCLGIEVEDTHTLSDTPGLKSLPRQFWDPVFGHFWDTFS